jgi:hypothetical protein
MKLQFKALSIILGLAAFLGTCASAQSGTPDISGVDSNVENSAEVVPQEIKLGDTQETQEVQDAEAEGEHPISANRLSSKLSIEISTT